MLSLASERPTSMHSHPHCGSSFGYDRRLSWSPFIARNPGRISYHEARDQPRPCERQGLDRATLRIELAPDYNYLK